MSDGVLSEKSRDILTLRSKLVYDHAGNSYFMRDLNDYAHKFFIRFRTNPESTSEYAWSRIEEVRLIRRAGSNPGRGGGSEWLESQGSGSGGTQEFYPTVFDGIASQSQSGPEGLSPLDSTGSGKQVSFIHWKDKRFMVCFKVEGFDKVIHLPRLSASLPTNEEVEAYCARAANAVAGSGNVQGETAVGVDGVQAVSSVTGENGESSSSPENAAVVAGNDNDNGGVAETGNSLSRYLPGAEEIEKMSAFKEQHFTHRKWTAEDYNDARESNNVLKRHNIGSLATQSTMVAMENMKLESQLGISSSYHMMGHSTASLESRQGDLIGSAATQQRTMHSSFLPKHRRKMQDSQEGGVAASSPLSPPGSQALEGGSQQGNSAFMTQNSFSQLASSPSLAALVGENSLVRGLSQRHLEAWKEAAASEDRFYAYIANEDRSAQLNKVAEITRRNALRNQKDRRQGIINEKKLQRTGNLLESGGLWIMDDTIRAHKAHQFKMEQDVDTAQKAPDTAGKKGGGADAAKKDGAKDATAGTDGAGGGGEESGTKLSPEEKEVADMVEMHKNTATQFDSVSDDFFDDGFINSMTQLISNASEKKASPSTSSSSSAPTPSSSSQLFTPNMLRKDNAAQSQILIHSVISTSRFASRGGVAAAAAVPRKRGRED